ncbi:hypothetical protein ARC23_09910 [Stenotrophomonas beteli]|uniref:DUF2846 domain-containing protein n=2 Tax=Stenotrophomonas beteli TaxID=3384461 RepID=A0A0R0BEC2_9GAMM|nr:hypothetical protein ARC23_09910 [Stenotrophomonas maltophilia]
MKKLHGVALAVAISMLSGCASVPMTEKSVVDTAKTFPAPQDGKSGVYVFRNSFVGKALKKDVLIDGECLGETADKVFFYTQVAGGQEHVISTESEFSPNDLKLFTEAGRNYFIQQSIKMGVFVGGAKLTVVPESEGRSQVMQLKMAQNGRCSK